MKTKVVNFIKNNLYKVISTAIAIIAISLLLNQCHKNNISEKKLQVAEQNIAALNDTIHLVKTKDNKPEFDKLAFLVDKVSNLEKLNADLAKEIHNTKGKVNTIISGGVQIVHDTTFLDAETTTDGNTIVTDFKFDTIYSKGNSRSIKGYTEYDMERDVTTAKLTKDSMDISFVTGIKDLDKGKPEIFLRSDYPGFKVTNLTGAILDPKLFQKKTKQHLITVGLDVGYAPLTYSLSKQKLDIDFTRFAVSAGLNINLTRLLGKK